MNHLHRLPVRADHHRANQLTSDSSAASGTSSYKYTTLNQVCYAGSSSQNACSAPPSGSTAYAYDAADNLTQVGSTQQAFNNADELCWTAPSLGSCASPPTGATTYTFDTRGNRTKVTPPSGGATTLTYDQANRLTGYGTSATYAYNGDGLRMSKTVSGSTSQFLWDVGSPLPLLLKDSSTAYVYGPGGLPLEQVNGSITLWLHHDQLGSTRLVTDNSGTSQATYSFDAYGNLAAITGSVTNPLRFAGQYNDSESGLYYLRARYYDAITGQFITGDPAVSTTRQPYGYVKGNPLNGADPTGMACWAFWDASKCNNAFSSWTAEHQAQLQDLGNQADTVAEWSGKIAAVCAIGAVVTSETVVGGVGFGACASVAGSVAVGSQLAGVGLHGLAGLGGNQRGWVDSGTDAVGLVTGRLVGGACKQVGANSQGLNKDVWNGLSDAFGDRFGGVYSSILRH